MHVKRPGRSDGVAAVSPSGARRTDKQAQAASLPVFDADDVSGSTSTILSLSGDLLTAELVQTISRREGGERLWQVGANALHVLREYGVNVAAWCARLEQADLVIRAYHSTRAPDATMFRQIGIKPLDVDELYERVRSKVLHPGSGYGLNDSAWCRFARWSATQHPVNAKLRVPKGPYLFLSRRVMDEPGVTKPHLRGPEFEADLFVLLRRFCTQEGLSHPEDYSPVLLRGTRGMILRCEIPLYWLNDDSRSSVFKEVGNTLFRNEAGAQAAGHYSERSLSLHETLPPEWIVGVEYTTDPEV